MPKCSPGTVDEIKHYLSIETEETKVDAIEWWIARWRSFPHLSRMALDYLTIPGEYNSFIRIPI